MDDQTVNYTEERYKEARKELEGLLKTVGYDISKINSFPTSGWLETPRQEERQYSMVQGLTILDALDAIIPPPKPLDKPLRVPIQRRLHRNWSRDRPGWTRRDGSLEDRRQGDLHAFRKVGECKTIEHTR